MMPTIRSIRQSLNELNFFESGSTEIEVIQQERWSSRIHIVFLSIILASIAIYTGLQQQITHTMVKNPSYETFLTLQQKYSSTLKCPCSKIAIKYETFLQLEPSYHQVCSSSFISEAWIMNSYGANSSNVWPMDARTVASSHAQFLRSFCKLSQLTLNSIVIDSLGSVLISPNALFADILELKINDQLTIARSTGPWFLTAALVSMRLSITSNQLISGLGSNAFIYMSPNNHDLASITVNTYQMPSGSLCHCYPTINCQSPAGIYSNPVEQTLDVYHLNMNNTRVKGMQIACSPLEGFLSSTLECYFDRTCLELLVSNSSIYTPLNSTALSQYFPNTTMEDLISELLVEKWLFDSSPSNYFLQCAPPTCEYSYTHRNSFLTIVVTIISLFTGLNTVFRLIIPWIVRYLFKLKKICLRRLPNAFETVVQPHSERIQINLQWLWTKIRNLNLFDSHSNDHQKIRRERYTTRLYLILLILIFFILFFYTTFTQQKKTFTIHRPTQNTYETLQKKYDDTIECPCSNTAIPYEEFLSVEAEYHQICSTGFISPLFIDQLFKFNRTNLHRTDLMLISGPYFRWFSSFCILCRVVIYNLQNSFQQELFVNSKILPEKIFLKQTDEIIQSFINSASLVFIRAIKEGLELTTSMQVLGASSTAFDLRWTSNETIRIDSASLDNCSCLLQPMTCSTAAGFFSYHPSNDSLILSSTLNDMRVACMPFLSFTQSSMNCWFSEDCYEQMIAYWRNRTDALDYLPPLLDRTIPSRYNTSTRILSILENLMIEQWSKQASYSAFFDKCDPLFCTYSDNERPSTIFIVTTLVGIFSGLNVVLKLCTPLILRAVFWCWANTRGHRHLFQQFKQFPNRFLSLNLFYDYRKSSIFTLRKEIRATRLYILLFISIFSTFLLSNILEKQTNTITIQKPTQPIYEQLFSSYNSSLQCPCAQITIPYKSFVNMSPRLHQICSSSFLDLAWLESIYGHGNWSDVPANEFRVRGVAYFSVLQSLCNIAKGKINSIGPYLFDRQMISSQVIPENQLISQINSEIDRLQRSFSSNFVTLIQFARDISHGNQLMTVYSLNWIFSPRYHANMPFYQIPTQPVRHGENCSCATSSTCMEPIFVNGEIIPGFVLGCSSLESLLRSTLSCLYNQTCIDLINIGNISTITPLDYSLSDRFRPNMTVEELIPSMFIEQWSSNVSYSTFFMECQPISCSYSVSQRKDILRIIAILLGIYGGLTTVLYFAVPFLITFFDKTSEKFQGTNNAVVPYQ